MGLRSAFPARREWLVPTIVELELAKWLTREVGEDEADWVVAFSTTYIVVELDTATALSAAELCAGRGLATVDAIVYATALTHRAELLTYDRHFESMAGVRFIAKAGR